MDSAATRRFRKLCLSTLVAVYILILVGGIVRTTGSGMGCPDWPRCFGSWTPPASVNELPENYKSIYAASREKKNVKFAKYLSAFGFQETATGILTDKGVQTETDFNVTKAWIEYGNRLVGVVIGFLIAAMFWKSWQFRQNNPGVFYLSLLTLVAVIIQGWFGSIVVSTNLTTWTITLHMFIALLIVAFIVRIITMVDGQRETGSVSVRGLLAGCMASLLLQVFFGTQVRAAIDTVADILPRSQWINALGLSFLIHRSFSIVVVVVHVILLVKLNKTMPLKALTRALIIIILGAVVTGISMAWGSVPAFLQPLHLLLATSAFGIQLYMFFELRPVHRVVNA